MSAKFEKGDSVYAFFHEHSIPSRLLGVVTKVDGIRITVRATDGWEGEAGNEVTVPEWNALAASVLANPQETPNA